MVEMSKKAAKKLLKANKIKTAFNICKAVGVGVCEGFIPFVSLKGAEYPLMYVIPFIPVVIYLAIRIVKDLKGWYEK